MVKSKHTFYKNSMKIEDPTTKTTLRLNNHINNPIYELPQVIQQESGKLIAIELFGISRFFFLSLSTSSNF